MMKDTEKQLEREFSQCRCRLAKGWRRVLWAEGRKRRCPLAYANAVAAYDVEQGRLLRLLERWEREVVAPAIARGERMTCYRPAVMLETTMPATTLEREAA